MAVRLYARSLCAVCKYYGIPTRVSGVKDSPRRLHTEQRVSSTPHPNQYQNQELPIEGLGSQTVRVDGQLIYNGDTNHELHHEQHLIQQLEAHYHDLDPASWRIDARLALGQGRQADEKTRNILEQHHKPTGNSTQENAKTSPTKLRSRGVHYTELLEQQFPINGQLLDHDIFREAIAAARRMNMFRQARRILREQLLRCRWPREILRVLAVAMQNRNTAREMQELYESMVRAIYRSRNNVTDARILSLINIITGRLQKAKLSVHVLLLNMGLKFAARARSLSGMKRYLKAFRDQEYQLSRPVFRSVIAKFSIGRRGLGEIRNGRWQRHELLQVLLGFKDTPPDRACHLGTFLERDDWPSLHVWLIALARCKAVDEIWKEWELWLKSPGRHLPKKLNIVGDNITTRTRGDLWFIEQMCYAGDIEKAWKMLEQSGMAFNEMRPGIKMLLLDHPEYANAMTEDIRASLLDKYAYELSKIERLFNARWVSTDNDGAGYHVLEGNLEDMLVKLGDPETLNPTDYGYPWESNEPERIQQQKLNEAEEVA